MTNVFMASEVRLTLTADGHYYATHPAAAYAAWLPYVRAFGQVTVVARAVEGPPDSTMQRADGVGVSVHRITSYHGLKGLLRNIPRMVIEFSKVGQTHDRYIGRLPEPLSVAMWVRSMFARGQYVSVLVSEPRQLFQAQFPGGIGRFVGFAMSGLVRHIVRRSSAVVYVTQEWLQSLYPAKDGVPTIGRSNVIIDPSSIQAPGRARVSSAKSVNLVSIGSLTTRQKGMDVLLEVIAELCSAGLNPRATIIGDGPLLPELRRHAASLALDDRVQFVGALHERDAINSILDVADVYVSCSRVEGLPRAVIEAMSRALPVVATSAGGTGELVQPKNLVPLDDVEQLTSRVLSLVTDDIAYLESSRHSIKRARSVVESSNPDLLTKFLVDHVS